MTTNNGGPVWLAGVATDTYYAQDQMPRVVRALPAKHGSSASRGCEEVRPAVFKHLPWAFPVYQQIEIERFGLIFAGERGPDLHEVSGQTRCGGTPPGNQ
jgi:hypothetical protein